MAGPDNERPTRETREIMVDKLRNGSDISKRDATRIADDSLRRVEGRIERGTLHRQPPAHTK